MWPMINIGSCVQIRINHWEASGVFLVVCFWYWLHYRVFALFWSVSQVARESWGCRFLPGTQGRKALSVSSAHVRLTQADAPGGAEGGPAETHLCHFLQCLLADFYLKGDAVGCWAFTPSNSKHATSSFILQSFSSLWKVWWFVFLLYPFFLC